MQLGTRYLLEVNPRIPQRLARLQELAGNLWYAWDRPTRVSVSGVFACAISWTACVRAS